MPEFNPHPEPIDCQGPLHPMAVRGFELYNARQYWKAHEALEQAWLEEAGEIRHLYRGILQVGVVYYHIQRGNYAGAVKVYARSQRWLVPFPPRCRGIDVAEIQHNLAVVMAEVNRLGPDRLHEFSPRLLKPMHWQN